MKARSDAEVGAVKSVRRPRGSRESVRPTGVAGVALAAAALLFGAVGCATKPPARPAVSAPAPTRAPAAKPVAPALPPPAAPATKSAEPLLKSPAPPAADEPVPAGMMRIRIESRPAGALIVVGDQIVGHAPVAVNVPVTLRGFFTERVVIRARFLAAGGGDSVSVKETCEEVDRVPAAIVFTPAGATRQAN